MNKVLFNHRLSVGVTNKMNDLLEEIAMNRTRRGTPISKSDLIREAIRLYLDEQADARGSRKQIAKSLEGQITKLHEELGKLQTQSNEQNQMLIQLLMAMQPVFERIKPRPK